MKVKEEFYRQMDRLMGVSIPHELVDKFFSPYMEELELLNEFMEGVDIIIEDAGRDPWDANVDDVLDCAMDLYNKLKVINVRS